MSPVEMVAQLETYFRHTLPEKQSETLVKKLGRFTDGQLDQIFEKTIEECKYLFARAANPVAQIFEVARDLGFVATRIPEHVPHTWTKTDCKLCGGQGMLDVFFEVFTDPETRAQTKRVTRIFPYASTAGTDYLYEHQGREYSSFARCSCPAGDARTLPGGRKWGAPARRPEAAKEQREFKQVREREEEECPF